MINFFKELCHIIIVWALQKFIAMDCSFSLSHSFLVSADSDDTDDIILGSQDLFASQGSRYSSQNGISVSQLIPTLQWSSDNQLSQGYEGFAPPR